LRKRDYEPACPSDCRCDFVFAFRDKPYGPRAYCAGKKREYRKEIEELRKQGFTKIRLDGSIVDLSEEIELDKNKKHEIDVIIDRISLREGIERRLFEAVELALAKANGIVKVETKDQTYTFSEQFACPDCGISYPEIAPRMFSFNNHYGACPSCFGLGVKEYFDPDLIVPNPDLSLRDGAILPWEEKSPSHFLPFLEALVKHYKIDIRRPFKELPKHVRDAILYGSQGEKIEFYIDHGPRRELLINPLKVLLPVLNATRKGLNSGKKKDSRDISISSPVPSAMGAAQERDALGEN
jgi:excinuclease ABC subunit A